jgi:hypothetical protein
LQSLKFLGQCTSLFADPGGNEGNFSAISCSNHRSGHYPVRIWSKIEAVGRESLGCNHLAAFLRIHLPALPSN